MSYCRGSSDNWKSDVYVIGIDEGWNIFVNSHRSVGVEKLPQLPEEPDDWKAMSEEEYAEWCDKEDDVSAEQIRLLKTLPKEDIDLPHAGECLCPKTHQELLDKLLGLRELGYHVPQKAIDRVKEEMA